jgi:peptidoglycan-associated lipoprotein
MSRLCICHAQFYFLTGEIVMKKLAVVAASLLVAACASTHKTDTSQADEKNTVSAAAAETTAAKMELSQLSKEISKLQKQSDYFDFNKAIVKPQYMAVIQKEAAFIKNHKQDVVTLQGNADERGSEKYNFALGEDRAQAVARTLEKDGVAATQIKLISLGKDKPRLTCHAEKCWKENRRVDFLHNIG